MILSAPESPQMAELAPEKFLESDKKHRSIELSRVEKKRIKKLGKFITNFEKQTTKFIHKFEIKEKRRPVKLVAALALTTALNGYMADVHQNQAEERPVEVSLKSILNTNSDSSIYFADGLYSLDADFLTSKIGPAIDQVVDSTLKSISVGDAPPGSDEIADVVIEDVEEEATPRVSLFGYSVGGVEITESAPKIIAESEATIDFIFLAHTPAGIDSLRPEKQFLINSLTQILSFTPWSESSDYVQKGVAFLFQANNYMPDGDLLNIDFEAIPKSWENADREVTANERPGISTLEYQVKLAKSNISDDIRNIAEACIKAGKAMPTIVYLFNKNDDTVDNEKALKTIQAAAEKYGIPIKVVEVDSNHSQYYTDSSVASYTQQIAAEIPDLLDSREAQEEILEISKWADAVEDAPDYLLNQFIDPIHTR